MFDVDVLIFYCNGVLNCFMSWVGGLTWQMEGDRYWHLQQRWRCQQILGVGVSWYRWRGDSTNKGSK